MEKVSARQQLAAERNALARLKRGTEVLPAGITTETLIALTKSEIHRLEAESKQEKEAA